MKLWDLRQFKSPVHIKTGLNNMFPMCVVCQQYLHKYNIVFTCRTECCFSPRDDLCVTGTSAPKSGGAGSMIILDRNTFDTVYEIKYENVVCVCVFE
jgi:hypothetical protein